MIAEELISARKKFKPFNSSHEGAAIIREELDELEEEWNRLNNAYKDLWENVKNNQLGKQIVTVQVMMNIMIDLISEAIQVASMCLSYRNDLG